ncbi:hypothetical protein ACPV5G_16140 [Photobacterium damselae]|uniref:hypothetical protein n=1 Tax=Photobacterium damselae TaxID=38293 RepID=UPI004068826C
MKKLLLVAAMATAFTGTAHAAMGPLVQDATGGTINMSGIFAKSAGVWMWGFDSNAEALNNKTKPFNPNDWKSDGNGSVASVYPNGIATPVIIGVTKNLVPSDNLPKIARISTTDINSAKVYLDDKNVTNIQLPMNLNSTLQSNATVNVGWSYAAGIAGTENGTPVELFAGSIADSAKWTTALSHIEATIKDQNKTWTNTLSAAASAGNTNFVDMFADFQAKTVTQVAAGYAGYIDSVNIVTSSTSPLVGEWTAQLPVLVEYQ